MNSYLSSVNCFLTNWFITARKPFYTTTSQIVPFKSEIIVKTEKILKSVQIVWLTLMPSFEYNWVSSSNPNPDSLLMKYTLYILFIFYGNFMFEYRLEGQSFFNYNFWHIAGHLSMVFSISQLTSFHLNLSE